MSLNQAKLFDEVVTSKGKFTKVGSYKPSKEILRTQISEISRSLEKIFPEKQTESKLDRARNILGDICINIDDDELISRLAQFQSLIESWINECERQIFEGNTLQQLLRGKNGCDK